MRLTILSLGLLADAPLAAQADVSWMRYPALSPDGQTIVFTYKGDLYRVATAGGVAVALTAHPGHDMAAVWSPDGRTIAFASERYGNFDVFVMPATGGEARRLTVHDADETPFAFTPDGAHLVFGAARLDAAASRLDPTGAQPELYQVATGGGGRCSSSPHPPRTSHSALMGDRCSTWTSRAGRTPGANTTSPR